MQTLKISDYAKYLESGLKVQYIPNGKDCFLSNIGRYGDVHLETEELGAGVVERHNIKPYLRPFSCLSQEIKYNGEWITPLEYLANMCGFGVIILEKSSDCIVAHTTSDIHFVFKNNVFFTQNAKKDIFVLPNQDRFFQKMDEWQIWYGDQSLFQTGEILELNS